MRSRIRSIVTATLAVVALLAASTVSSAEVPLTEAPALAASSAITVDIEQLESALTCTGDLHDATQDPVLLTPA
ncbi:MAG: lipase, partial [Rhodococcus sp. (in: high G+C Gram-positive bacteria)]